MCVGNVIFVMSDFESGIECKMFVWSGKKCMSTNFT